MLSLFTKPPRLLTTLTLAVCLLSGMPGTVRAIMPPEVYATASREAQIKAIATVMDVKTTAVGKYYSTKLVAFEREYALTKDTPVRFTGTCTSVETESQKANSMVGGNIYFYPSRGERVFVTISDEGGSITSMTPMTPELERVIRKEPGRLRYGISRVSIADKAAIPEPVLRGKEPLPETQHAPLSALDGEHPGTDDTAQGSLISAVGMDDVEQARRAIAQGADVNRPLDRTGTTVLMTVESEPMARLLLACGANPKATTDRGLTVLHTVPAKKDAVKLVPLYAKAGADINQPDDRGQRPLFVAADYLRESGVFKDVSVPEKNLRLMQAMIDAGADLEGTDTHGNTLLIQAVSRNDSPMVQALLSLGADPAFKGPDGVTARSLAYELGYRNIYQLLQ